MTFMRKAAMAAMMGCGFILSLGCGDAYRPIATPITNPAGDPANVNYAAVANNNPYIAPGAFRPNKSSVSLIDVSGDTNLGNVRMGVGVTRLYFVGLSNTVAVADTGEDAVSFTSFASLGTTQEVATASLRAGSYPIALAPMPASYSKTYSVNANPNSDCPASGSIGAIDLSAYVFLQDACVGPAPVYAVINSDQLKVWVLDASGVVYLVNTLSMTLKNPVPIAVGNNPVMALLSPLDGAYLYVLNQGDATITVIDAKLETVVTTVPTGGSGPTHMALDRNLNRLWVVNTASNSVSVFDISNPAAPVPWRAKPPVTVGSTPTSIGILPDGSKAYVANYGSNTVSVIDGNALTVSSIAVGANPALTTHVNWVAVSSDGSRVYATTVMTDDTKNGTSIIHSGTGMVVATIPAPLQCNPDLGENCTCIPSAQVCPLQRPVFVAARGVF